MDKGLTVPKWVLIAWPKIPQMPQKISSQYVCPTKKVWNLKKSSLWVFVAFSEVVLEVQFTVVLLYF